MKTVFSVRCSVFGVLRIIILCILITEYCPPITPVLAQQMPQQDRPLEITADHTLEWHRNSKQYIARGNVVMRQGDVTIAADTLTADYRETEAKSFEIYRLTADGNVRIDSQGNSAMGQQATYDVDQGVAVMTGDNLRMSSPDQVVTARESFEYWVRQGKLTARGGARVVRAGDMLDADVVSAVFTEDAAGRRKLQNLSADGNVKITTPDEVLTGRKGQYSAVTNIAELTGGVKITRGPNVLEGERAEVNLNNNVSTMKGGIRDGGDGRVRGVFYPDSAGKDKNNAAAPRQAPVMEQKKPMLPGR